MTVDRIKRVNEMLRREVAGAVLQLPADAEFDRSVITVTKVDTSRNLRTAVVSVSVRDYEKLGRPVLAYLRRHRVALQSHVNAVMNLKYTPRLSFRLDCSIAKGDQVLDVLLHLDLPETEASEDGEPV